MGASMIEPAAVAPTGWVPVATPYLFFTGKGGVGKTSIASATATGLADAGRRVLLVSTDPASNLDDVFGMVAGQEPTTVLGFSSLQVMNLDPGQAAASYRERVVGPYRGVLPEEIVSSMEEQLSGACTVEIAAFDEFTTLLADPTVLERHDHVIFDTAPTGHTLRLMSLPSAWTGFLDTNTTGTSCLGPLAGLDRQREQYGVAMRTLAEPGRTTVILVSRPEESALREAARAGEELAALGIQNQHLVVNGVLADPDPTDQVATAYAARQRAALHQIPDSIGALPRTTVPLVRIDLTGIAALRALQAAVAQAPRGAKAAPVAHPPQLPGFSDLLAELEHGGPCVIMTMGKGGVGKTTVAARLAQSLAARGHRVHLTTTDPAAHLVDAVGSDRSENLVVGRIDPQRETQQYSDEVIAAAGELDAEARALLEEDLRSPCTEEIAVFRAFARTVDEAQAGYVVLDTAPTGHTLLLLDATQAYHKEVERNSAEVPPAVRALLGRLRDPAYTRVLVVTLAESTPVEEAARLQADLRRAEIEPFGWVLNASLLASGTADPVLAARAALEAPHIERVVGQLAQRAWVIPWDATP